jgi:hypothetical protein
MAEGLLQRYFLLNKLRKNSYLLLFELGTKLRYLNLVSMLKIKVMQC